MWKRMTILASFAVVVAVAGAFVACDDDEDNGGETTPTAGATEPSETAAEGTTVEADLSEFAILPDPASVPAGSVTFNANNIGAEVHELVVIKSDLAPDALPTSEDGSADEAGEGVELIGEIEEFASGGSESATFELESGAYVLICNVVEEEEDGTTESHYAEGMYVGFTVE